MEIKKKLQLQELKNQAIVVILMGLILLVIKTPALLAEQVKEDTIKERVNAQNMPLPDKVSGDPEELISQAQKRGKVPIIVGLKTDFQPEGYLANSQVLDQRLRIKNKQNNLLQKISQLNFDSVKKFQYIPYLALRVDEETLKQLISLPEVTSIQEDIPVPPILASSIPVIDADDAWAAGYTGSGQTIAILDTGVDKTHSFLTGKVVSEACYSTTNVTYSSTTVCPNGQESQTGSGAGVNCSDTIYGCDHGTHVAGIAAGDGVSYDGVARDADLIAIQIFSEFDDSDICGGEIYTPCALSYTSDQILGLERVYALRGSYDIASVNMSLGGQAYSDYCDSDSRKSAIDNLRSADIATVIATGNEYYWGAISAPACISTAVSVGSSNDSDEMSIFANIANFVDLLAPGENITSSVPGDTYAEWNGTSMATPHVAGAWAVLKSKLNSATVDEVLDALTSTGVPISDTWFGITYTIPRIDLDDALDAIEKKLIIKDSSNTTVATLSNLGDIVLKGTCTAGGTCSAPTGSFIIQNSSGGTVGYIDDNGNLCVETGDCADESDNCNSPTGDAFIVQDSSGNNVIYIDQNGDLCLTGTLTVSGSP